MVIRKLLKFPKICFHLMVSTFRPLGQVGKNSEFGRWITLLSSLAENETIVEVGTWNGRGTSARIVDGVKMRNPKSKLPNVVGFEIDQRRFRQASKYLKRHSFFQVIYGRLIEISDLDQSSLAGDEASWFQEDLSRMSSSPLRTDAIPEFIDLLILDGGEFSTKAEFDILKSLVRGWILLDDIHMRKCIEVHKILMASEDFRLISISDERNGTSIFKRVH